MKLKLLKIVLDKDKNDECGRMVDQDAMKGPTPIEESRVQTEKDPIVKESKFARVKRLLSGQQQQQQNRQNQQATTYDEAKASCKARKRKERQESVSSIVQERKVIRSNSEERPINKDEKDIRRVSSHEDFQKTPPKSVENDVGLKVVVEDQTKKVSPCRDVSIDVFIYHDESEFERRRSHERFSKPMMGQRPKYSMHGRKPRVKHFHKKDKLDAQHVVRRVSPKRTQENDLKKIDIKSNDLKCNDLKKNNINDEEISCNFLQLRNSEEKERSPSPVNTPISPPLDLSTLHEQIDCSEPIPSSSNRLICENTETMPSLSVASNRLLLSPRNSVIITQRIYLSSEVPQNNTTRGTEERNPKEEKLKQIAKQINSIKKKLKKYDEEFETKFGYRPSHADKLNDKTMKKLCAELSKLKKEQKQLKENDEYFMDGDENEKGTKIKKEASLQDTLMEIENRLNAKRVVGERSETIEQMSNEQLVEEKIAVQKALLHLESMHGRPTNKEDRDLVRPIYDRYRQLKRMVRLTTPCNNINELATILEHETMDFVSAPTQTPDTEADKQNTTGTSTDSDTDTSVGENLHSLSYEELTNEHRLATEEKKNLRRSLKQFEEDFQTRTGKKLQKEDKTPMEHIYSQYKKTKAKLRLLDALLGKQAL
nr:protein FAM13A isoform X1 [Onthophagus taurus]